MTGHSAVPCSLSMGRYAAPPGERGRMTVEVDVAGWLQVGRSVVRTDQVVAVDMSPLREEKVRLEVRLVGGGQAELGVCPAAKAPGLVTEFPSLLAGHPNLILRAVRDDADLVVGWRSAAGVDKAHQSVPNPAAAVVPVT
ncbi:hypothetical protein AB0D08_30635 [Kitasatospora sp. NPDC048540]|uniref:hypothetical protein n=1 Tax=Kitasatospora sp. NPDC048540 TaxID=3155634 RepID=UPI0033E5F4EA